MTIASPALISIKDVSKSYRLGDSDVEAVRSVSLEISGGIVALMGPSGSGKSTLLNLIGALDSVTTGEIAVNGLPIGPLNDDQRAAFRSDTVGFVFQSFNLIPVLTTIENVTLPNQLNPKFSSADATARALSLLESVGLEDQVHQSVNRLSGGQMQRVAIARALMNKPSILLADEPTANLDKTTARVVLEILRSLATKENTTVVIATHDHTVLEYCDRIIALRDGSLAGDELRQETIKN